MKALDPDFAAHLVSGVTTLAWCWRITRADGEVFGFTDHDRPLAFDGTDFTSETGLIPSELRHGSDLAVDAQDAQGVLSSSRITEADILDGRWDNASIEVWRVNWRDVAQRVLLRVGAIGEIRRGRVAFIAEMRSLAHLLGQQVGRSYQYTCDAELGDGRCGVDLGDPAFRGSGAVLAVRRGRVLTTADLPGFAPRWFAGGLIEWTGGANAGRRAEILRHDVDGAAAILTLLAEPVRAVAPGDTFVATAGCDKRIETCGDKFANVVNFRGFPHIPGSDTVLRYASPDADHRGRVL